MIKFTLKCDECPDGHRFESWFQSADAFDALKAAGHVSCAICGSPEVEKAIMAPRVRTARAKASAPPPPEAAPETPADGAPAMETGKGALSTPANPIEAAMAALKDHVEKTSEYVGRDFSETARAMHDGDTPERPIYGEAKPEEAKALIEDGIPVAPLPFMTGRKTN